MRRFAFATVVAAAFVAATPAQVAPPADIDALLGSLPGVVATYEAKSDLGGVVALDGLTIALKKADGTPDDANKVTIERAEAAGLDGEAILTVFDGARYGAQPDQTFRTLFGRLDLRGVAIVDIQPEQRQGVQPRPARHAIHDRPADPRLADRQLLERHRRKRRQADI